MVEREGELDAVRAEAALRRASSLKKERASSMEVARLAKRDPELLAGEESEQAELGGIPAERPEDLAGTTRCLDGRVAIAGADEDA